MGLFNKFQDIFKASNNDITTGQAVPQQSVFKSVRENNEKLRQEILELIEGYWQKVKEIEEDTVIKGKAIEFGEKLSFLQEQKQLIAEGTDGFKDTEKTVYDLLEKQILYINGRVLMSGTMGTRNLFKEVEKVYKHLKDYYYGNFEKRKRAILETLENDIITTKAGIIGEERLQQGLELFNDVLKIIYNLRIKSENATAESDAFILTDKGIFCVEVKNYGENAVNDVIRIANDGKWTRKNSKGENIPISDATAQINRHIGITQKVINKELKKIHPEAPYIKVKPLIVIANDNITLENESIVPVYRISSIYPYLESLEVDKNVKEHLDIVEKILKENNLSAKPYPVPHYIVICMGNVIKLVELAEIFEKMCTIGLGINDKIGLSSL